MRDPAARCGAGAMREAVAVGRPGGMTSQKLLEEFELQRAICRSMIEAGKVSVMRKRSASRFEEEIASVQKYSSSGGGLAGEEVSVDEVATAAAARKRRRVPAARGGEVAAAADAHVRGGEGVAAAAKLGAGTRGGGSEGTERGC